MKMLLLVVNLLLFIHIRIHSIFAACKRSAVLFPSYAVNPNFDIEKQPAAIKLAGTLALVLSTSAKTNCDKRYVTVSLLSK